VVYIDYNLTVSQPAHLDPVKVEDAVRALGGELATAEMRSARVEEVLFEQSRMISGLLTRADELQRMIAFAMRDNPKFVEEFHAYEGVKARVEEAVKPVHPDFIHATPIGRLVP